MQTETLVGMSTFGVRLRGFEPADSLDAKDSPLTEAGFTLHNCAPHHPQYRLGVALSIRNVDLRT
jgi:hypothetical protein